MPSNSSTKYASVGNNRMQREKRPLIALLGASLLVLLGLLLLGRTVMAELNSNSNNKGKDSRPYAMFLLKDDLKSHRLDAGELASLKGVYYAKEPSLESLKPKYDDGEKIITREELPEKTRVLPKGAMSTLDWVEDRLNVHLNNDNYIEKAKYG